MNDVFRPDLLAGKRIVVAGASSGLGRAVAQACADVGATIYAVGRSKAKLETTLDGLSAPTGPDPHKFVVGDLSSFDAAATTFKQVQDLSKGVDGVFYSAGAEVIKSTRSLKIQDVERTMGAALHGALGAAKVCASKRFWRQTGRDAAGGSLVIMSSVSAQSGQTGMAAYGAARAGILGLTRNLSIELAPMNIRVNAIVAGAVATEMHGRITQNLPAAAVQSYYDAHPLGVGHPSDISNLSVYLLSIAGAWITGTELIVDGGYLA